MKHGITKGKMRPEEAWGILRCLRVERQPLPVLGQSWHNGGVWVDPPGTAWPAPLSSIILPFFLEAWGPQIA